MGTNKKHLTWFAAILTLLCFISGANKALAQSGRYFELTLSGSYETRYSQYRENQRKSYGVELLVPLTSFLQLSAGHTFVEDKDIYNDEYRAFQAEQNVALPDGPLFNISTYADTTGNGVLYYNFGYVRPSVFGGVLLRTYCEENPLIDYGCVEQDPTWNAGAGLSMIITLNLRLNISHRVSPAVTYETDGQLDGLTSVGLTIMY